MVVRVIMLACMVLTIHANSEHNFFRLTSNEMGNVLNYITALQEHSHNVG